MTSSQPSTTQQPAQTAKRKNVQESKAAAAQSDTTQKSESTTKPTGKKSKQQQAAHAIAAQQDGSTAEATTSAPAAKERRRVVVKPTEPRKGKGRTPTAISERRAPAKASAVDHPQTVTLPDARSLSNHSDFHLHLCTCRRRPISIEQTAPAAAHR